MKAYDPAGMAQARALLPEVTFCEGPYACAENADAVVICTGWEQFRALDLARIGQLMRQPVLIDLHNIYDVEEMEQAGFIYSSIGRPRSRAQLRRMRESKMVETSAQRAGDAVVLPFRAERHVTAAPSVDDFDVSLP